MRSPLTSLRQTAAALLVGAVVAAGSTSSAALAAHADADEHAPGVYGWTLAWSDEFGGRAGSPADERHWTYETGGNGWGNQELQYYTDSTDNAAHDGEGNLVITLREVDDPEAADLDCWYGPCEFTSARLMSQGKVEFAHGRIETRVKLPDGEAGIWPAFWGLGGNLHDVGWPRSGEIDVMEYVGTSPDELFGTVHGPGYTGGDSIGDTYDFGESIGGEWVRVWVEWEPNSIRWFAQRDGHESVEFFEVTPDDVPEGEWVFEHPFFFIANMAIGGNFGGPVSDELTFPQEYVIDYVRVYKAEPVPVIVPIAITIAAAGLVGAIVLVVVRHRRRSAP